MALSSDCDLPPPESPATDQPGGFGFFVRMELLWGRIRRQFLRRFCPGHVKRWAGLRQGHCDEHANEVIDSRDLKFIRSTCGYSFDPAIDVYKRRESMGFARYGYAELIGFSIILGLVSTIGSVLAVLYSWHFFVLSTIGVVFWIEVIWFFRDPVRPIPSDPTLALSPADGVVTAVEIVDEPGINVQSTRISIFLSIFDVHGNRVPRHSRVEKASYFKGRYLDARHKDCAKQNEQLWLDLVDVASGTRFRVKQISGAIARRIVCWVRVNEELSAGERYGMIKFGSRTDLIVPNAAIEGALVKVGDRVRGGITPLMKWKV